MQKSFSHQVWRPQFWPKKNRINYRPSIYAAFSANSLLWVVSVKIVGLTFSTFHHPIYPYFGPKKDLRRPVLLSLHRARCPSSVRYNYTEWEAGEGRVRGPHSERETASEGGRVPNRIPYLHSLLPATVLCAVGKNIVSGTVPVLLPVCWQVPQCQVSCRSVTVNLFR